MKQLIKMSVAVLGVLCGSVSGTQIPAVNVGAEFSEANARIRRNVPIVHQYRLENLPGWPDLRVSMRINPVSLHGGIGAVNDICAPLNGIPGVDPEFWITVISRRSIQSTQQDAIQFRPQWVRLNDWHPGETANCSSVSHVRTFFNGWSQRDVFASQGLSLHPANGDPNTMAVSPSCFNLPAQVQNGGSFSVVYHTVCQNINRDIYGIILVYDDADMRRFSETEDEYVNEQLQEIFPDTQEVEEELRQQVIGNARAAYRTRSIRDVFRNAPVIENDPQLQAIFQQR